MKRVSPILLILSLLFFVGDLAANDSAENLTADKPNILWIMSEDNSKHYLKMFDETGASTPNIEKLAVHGITYDRAFSNAPVCSVARTTLITGVYAPRLGTQFHRRIKSATMPTGWKMFPAYLREAGYYTTNSSKKDYNAVETDGVWDESSNRAHWRNRDKGKPFFHVQTFTDSHESSLHFKQDWVDNPDNKTDPSSVTLAPYHPDTPLFRLTYARYHDRIQVIDDKVGKMIQQLEDDGELENTFVFYFGDHGGVLPRGKGFANESGLHVPLVVRVPERWKQLSPMANGTRTNGFVEFVDFAPSVLKLAGVDIPKHFDGSAFIGNGTTADEINSRNETFGHADRMDEKYDMVRTLRRGNWKYIRNYQAIYPDGLQNNYRYINLAWQEWREHHQAGKLNEAQKAFFESKPAEQLFDLSSDPHEIKDLAKDPAHNGKLLEMRTTLAEQVKSLPDLSFFPESVLVNEVLDNPIEFGQSNKEQIATYVDIADLALKPFDDAAESLAQAIKSTDPIQRYWAYTVCAIHGKSARPLIAAAKVSMEQDSDALVRLRAAEFLGQIGEEDPIPTIKSILQNGDDPVVNLIALQSLVHFKDGGFGYDTTFDTKTAKALESQGDRRIGYLDGLSVEEIKERERQKRRKNKQTKK